MGHPIYIIICIIIYMYYHIFLRYMKYIYIYIFNKFILSFSTDIDTYNMTILYQYVTSLNVYINIISYVSYELRS